MARFDDFVTFDDAQLIRMKDETVRLATDLLSDGSAPRWLSLLGTSGAGKTMLARRVSTLFRIYRRDKIDWPRSERSRTATNPYGRVIRWTGGFLNWGEAINQRMLQGDYAFLDDLRKFDFFVIDDILSEYEKHRALSAAKLYYVLEGRLGKWTLLTANVSLQQIGEQLDPRIASRMLRNNGVIVDVDVPDYNLR